MEPTARIRLAKALKQMIGAQADILGSCFDYQRDFILSESRYKASLSTRRAGKSWAAAYYLIYTAVTNPGSMSIYIALTRDQAKRIMLQESADSPMFNLLRKLRIEFDYNAADLKITFPNKSIIYFTGLNNNEREGNKWHGAAYKLVIIDEAQDYVHDLNKLINADLGPAVGSVSGTFVLLGTPDDYRDFFFKVTREDLENRIPGWEVYNWTWKQNPHVRFHIKADLDKRRKDFPGFDTDTRHEMFTGYMQEYEGKWITDGAKTVYKFKADRNVIKSLPAEHYEYIMGVDFGFEDASACVTVAYSKYDLNLYIIDAFAKPHLSVSEFAEHLSEQRGKLNKHARLMADPAAKQAIDEINMRYPHLSLEAAAKTDKLGFISIINAEFLSGRIKLVVPDETHPINLLIKQLETLPWDPKRLLEGSRIEHPRMPNDLCDCMLYAFREARHFMAKEKDLTVESESQRYMREIRKRASARVINMMLPLWKRKK